MEPGHHISRDLGNGRRHLGIGILISPAERHKAVFSFHFLGIGEIDRKFFGDLLSNGIAANRNRPQENTAAVDKNQIRAAPSHVEDHIAAIFPHHIGLGGIVNRSRRDLHRQHLQPRIEQRRANRGNQFVLDRYKQRLELLDRIHGFFGALARFRLLVFGLDFKVFDVLDQLVIPDHLVQRIGHRLFGFRFNHLGGAGTVSAQRRQFAQTLEGMKARNGQPHLGGLELILGHQFPECAVERFRKTAVIQLLGEFLDRIAFQGNGIAGPADGKFRHFDAGTADVDCKNRIFLQHILRFFSRSRC
ncbi:hypothetical protein SDC9_77293 [bioreactor metagenome]|uniref:Uncharacterized protein n=1 Tax=bioreactor metagenome TaxID=1076179 RepID=A0A644YWB8_9ZZZZ